MWIVNILMLNLLIVFAIELPVGFFLGARSFKQFITMALINIMTNPAVVLCRFAMVMYCHSFEPIEILVLELLVIAIEGFMFSKFISFNQKNPYFISFILNVLSYGIGELIKIFF